MLFAMHEAVCNARSCLQRAQRCTVRFAAYRAMHAAQTLPLPSDSAALALPTLSPPVSQGSKGVKCIKCIKRETPAEGAAAFRAVRTSALRAQQPRGCAGIAKPPFVHTYSTQGARTMQTHAHAPQGCTHGTQTRHGTTAPSRQRPRNKPPAEGPPPPATLPFHWSKSCQSSRERRRIGQLGEGVEGGLPVAAFALTPAW